MKGPFCLLFLLLGTAAVAAPRPLSSSEQAVLNFGFATQLGSGIYALSGDRTLQVYRLPFGYTLPHDDEARLQVRLTIPLTIGFVDFEPRDVIENGVPKSLDTFSLVPGVEIDYAVNDRWHVQPFAEAGIARDRNADVDQRVYSLGMRGRYDVASGAVDWQGYGELVHVVVEQLSFDETDDFTRLRIGATARRPFDVDQPGLRADFLVYGFTEAFTDTPSALRARNGTMARTCSSRWGSRSAQPKPCGSGASAAAHRLRLPVRRGLSVYRVVFGSPY